MFAAVDTSTRRSPGMVVQVGIRPPRRNPRAEWRVDEVAAGPGAHVSSPRRDPVSGTSMTHDPASSIDLDVLLRARAGDQDALTRLVTHYRPKLERWAHARLPPCARGMEDTRDIVEDAMAKAVLRLPSFEPHGPHAWGYYLRTAVKHEIVDRIRRARARPVQDVLDENLPSRRHRPDEDAIVAELMERYAQALRMLPPDMQEMLVDSLEWEMSHAEIAAKFGKPSADAARMAVRRAVLQLAAIMADLCGEAGS
jgi:RNA polymerase sigma-70 factor, ECF subfamily